MKKSDSAYRFKNNNSVDRISLEKYVYESTLHKKIESVHITAIITILFEEMTEMVLNEKDINIGGFAILKLIKFPIRKVCNNFQNKIQFSKESISFRFYIQKKLKKLLLKYLNIDETLESS